MAGSFIAKCSLALAVQKCKSPRFNRSKTQRTTAFVSWNALCRHKKRLAVYKRRSTTTCAAATVLSPELVFDGITLCAMPLYALMIWAPRHPLTQRLLGDSKVPLYLGAALYLAALFCWNPLPLFWTSLTSAMNGTLLPNLSVFASAFSHSKTTVLTWINLIVMDFYQARWVYLDGMKYKVPFGHSAILCFMVGPLGLLSHLLTRWLFTWRRRWGYSRGELA